MKTVYLAGCAALAALCLARPASAADAKLPGLPAQFNWTGLYVGGHVGFSRGDARFTIFDPAPNPSANHFGGLFGGVQAGYNYVLPSRILLGVEADISFPNYLDQDDRAWTRIRPDGSEVFHQIDYVATARARVGYVFDRWMVYGTGGFAWSEGRFKQSPGLDVDDDKELKMLTGWTAGAGAELAIGSGWSTRVEYLYTSLGGANAMLPSGLGITSAIDIHTVRVGLNRKIWPWEPVADAEEKSWSGSDRWEIHGQSTYIQQGYGRFRSPYAGVNSFTPDPQTRNTWSNSAFLGVRLWQGGELYYNPELLQGFGLHDTTGAAGYPSGEAQKSNFPYPHYNTSRLFLRQTFGFGGEQEKLEGGPNQLSGMADISRLTVQVGKFAVTDVFDGNAYAKDTRKDFMNWALWAPGAFDYSADKVGLTYGATAELNQKQWALRFGYFLMPAESNANNFDTHVFERGSYVAEAETRWSLFSRPGKLRTIIWLNSVFSGSYRETLDDPALNLDIAQTRRGRIKYGYAFNVEQSITDDIGIFGRWSWNDGKTEIMTFTDIDDSLSFGASVKGTKWGRAKDVVGIGAVTNGLSQDHRDFLAAGGLGVLIGDGRLNYQRENILEAYYAFAVNDALTLTFDYQLLVNPAYNADRGPISIFSGRLHAEF
jgi:high affinity Mn2+ porin